MEKTVLKSELVSVVKEETGLTKKDAKKAVDALVDFVEKSLAKGKRVRVAHFGTFYTKTRKKGTIITPNGKKVKVPAMELVHFKASKTLKEAVNKKKKKKH
jgi:DNA-binding protein HU-beta